MAAIEEGRRCIVAAGRRAGEEVEISRMLEGNLVLVKGKKGERKVSIKQLTPLDDS